MFELTREVRFAINDRPDDQLAHKPANSFGGHPSLTGLGHYFALQITLAGELHPQSNYLQNIKLVDAMVRDRCIPMFGQAIRDGRFGGGGQVVLTAYGMMRDPWPGISLREARLLLSPHLSLGVHSGEFPMIRLSQRFEFSASHRLFNPALSEAENQRVFGKCSNPHGHGHNYELRVTLRGEPDANGLLVNVPDFERIVAANVIDRFDHKNLNLEVPEFRDTIPSVENIARTIHRLLNPCFTGHARLASVTVWETPKTWCEYSE